MAGELAIILTDNLHDYALAASCRVGLARREGWSSCWPALHSGRQEWGTDALRSVYGYITAPLKALVPGADPARRSRELLKRLDLNGGAPVPVSSRPSVEELLLALLRSLRDGRLLVFDDALASACLDEEPAMDAGMGEKLLVVPRGCDLALPAALYATMTGRRCLPVDNLEEAVGLLAASGPASVIFIDEFRTFTKPFLDSLISRSLAGPSAPVTFGIMTAYSAAHFTSMTCRLFMHREFHLGGHRLAEPADLEPMAITEMPPMEYYVIAAHGNEMHLRHKTDEILCGALAERELVAGVFNCEPRCRHSGRVRSSALPAQTVLLLSCDAFTLGDGLVPAGYNVLLNLLSGWTTTVLAPTKHVLGNPSTVMLVDALVRSNFSLGEVSLLLNSLSRYGESPDPAYLVLGDPDLAVSAGPSRATPSVSWRHVADGLEIETSEIDSRAVEIVLPAALLDDILVGQAPELEPLMDELLGRDIFFSFHALPTRGEVTLIVFAPEPLRSRGLRLRLRPANRLDDGLLQRALAQLRRLRALAESEICPTAVPEAHGEILSLLRLVAGYPRAVELLLVGGLGRNLEAALELKYRETRHRVLAAIAGEMESSRIWPSQKYSRAYPTVRPLTPTSPGRCPACEYHTFLWSFEDSLTELPVRHLLICDRCGIISDLPASPNVDILFAPRRSLTQTREFQSFLVRNVSPGDVRVTALLQFNQWKELGLEVEPAIIDAHLAPGEEFRHTVEIRCSTMLPDEILHMHLFVLTDSFGLHFASQKVVAMVRSTEFAN